MPVLLIKSVKWDDVPDDVYKYSETRITKEGQDWKAYSQYLVDNTLGHKVEKFNGGIKHIVGVSVAAYEFHNDGNLSFIEFLTYKLSPPRKVKVINNFAKPTTNWDINPFDNDF